MGVGRALVEARVGIESQKARGPRSIVVRVAVTNGVCGRVVMWVLREPFEAVNIVCVRRRRVECIVSGRIGWQGRHELVKNVRMCGSRCLTKSLSSVAKRRISQYWGNVTANASVKGRQ